jgi:MFS family permease
VTNPLRRPTFAWFLAGRLTSMLGSAMAPVALAFAVLNVAHRAMDLGVVLAANVIPHLLLLAVGGATADRLGRRAVLLAVNLGSALTQGLVAAILLTGNYSLPLVAALEFGNGALAAFTSPALRGIVPELVYPPQIQKANALLGAAGNATKIVGPGVAGVLVAAVGSGPAIAADAVSFTLAALCLLWLNRSPHTATGIRHSPRRRARRGRSSPDRTRGHQLGRDIRQGWTYFRSVSWLWPVSLAFFVVNLVHAGPWQVLGPQLVGTSGDPQVWGLLLSVRAVGLLVVSVLMYRFTTHHLLRLTLAAGALAAAPLLGIGLGLPSAWLLAATLVGGAGFAASSISWDTALQEHVPPDRLSRVASLDDLVSYAAIPAGQLAVGPLAEAVGSRTVCLVAAVGWIAATLLPLVVPQVRHLTPAPRPIAG